MLALFMPQTWVETWANLISIESQLRLSWLAALWRDLSSLHSVCFSPRLLCLCITKRDANLFLHLHILRSSIRYIFSPSFADASISNIHGSPRLRFHCVPNPQPNLSHSLSRSLSVSRLSPNPSLPTASLMKLYELWLCRCECTINFGLFAWLPLSLYLYLLLLLLLLAPSCM